MTAGRAPRLLVEAGLHGEGYALVAGTDEVGRGALCGPVTVGVVLVAVDAPRPPRGLRDSKLLSPAERERLVPRITRWVRGHAVGHASAGEIDEIGIIAALRLAGHRALDALPERPHCVLLDGNHDYLTHPPAPDGDGHPAPPPCPPVRTVVKADLRCASVAAASVLAKTTRDAIMVDLAAVHPGYGWEVNKGYATPAHTRALRQLGPSAQHRVSWRLPGLHVVGEDDGMAELPDVG